MKNKFIKKMVALTLAGCLALSGFPSVAFSDGMETVEIEAPAEEVIAAPTAELIAEPTAEPTVEPTTELTVEPMAEPTAEPTTEPTAELTAESKAEPTDEPTAEPMVEPAAEPTAESTVVPIADPTAEPMVESIDEPTVEPTDKLTAEPTAKPTAVPTAEPTVGSTMPIVVDIPLFPENVLAVQKMIDWLPSANALDEENMAAAYEQTEVAYDAYLALNANEQAQIIGAEKFTDLFAVFNAQVALLGGCKVSVIQDEHCGVSASPEDGAAGTLVTVTFTPDEGYYVDWVFVIDYDYGSVDHTKVSDTVYTFNLPDSSWAYVNYTVKVKNNYYTITTEAGEGGTIEVPASAQENASVTLTVKPNNGYQLSSLMVDGEDVTSQVNSSNQYTFTMPGKSINISATFTGGQVSFEVKIGEKVPFGQTVDAGTSFSSWYMSYAGSGAALGTGYWRIKHADGTNGSGTTSELGAIQDGDVYTQFALKAYYYGQYILQIFADCDVNELDNVSGYSYIISAGSLTVHHTVDGADKSFVLTGSKTKLSDFADGAQWCVNGEVVDMSSTVPLTETAYTTAQSYNISIAASENGSVSANPASAYQGKPVTLTIAPAAGYSLSALIVNDEDVTASVSDGTYTFVMPKGDVQVSATFSLTAYRVSANNPSYGEITLSDAEATEGTEITVTVIPTTCYTLQKLTVDGENVTAQVTENAYTFTMPRHNVAVNAEFVVIDYSIQGATATDGKAKVGDTLTVTPHDQEFVLWFGDDGYFSENQSLTVAEKYAGKTITCKIYEDLNHSPAGSGGYNVDYPAATLTVQVEQAGYSITLNADPAGSAYIEGDKTAAEAGETIYIGYVAVDGYQMPDSITVRDEKNQDVLRGWDVEKKMWFFKMPASNVTITVKPDKLYSITAETVTGGTITLKQSTCTEGKEVLVYVKPEDIAYRVLSVTAVAENGDNITATKDNSAFGYTFIMPASNVTVTATFEQRHEIKGTGSFYYGTIELDNASLAYFEGDTVTLKVAPEHGYELSAPTVTDANGNTIPTTHSDDDPYIYTFTMPDCDVTVSATFTQVYNVTVNADPAGSAYIEGNKTAAKENETITIAAADGYRISGISATADDGTHPYVEWGEEDSYGNSLTAYFTMPANNVTVDVETR